MFALSSEDKDMEQRGALISLISNEHISSREAQVTASKAYTIKDTCNENLTAKIEKLKEEVGHGFNS